MIFLIALRRYCLRNAGLDGKYVSYFMLRGLYFPKDKINLHLDIFIIGSIFLNVKLVIFTIILCVLLVLPLNFIDHFHFNNMIKWANPYYINF